MTSANRISRRLSTTALTLAVIAALSPHVKAQEPPQVHVGGATITGLPSDWSHHHVIYGNPGTEQDAIKNGTHEQWLKVVNDPRYIVQNLKRGLPVQGPAAQDVEMRYRIEDHERRMRDGWHDRDRQHKKPDPTLVTMHRDWSMSTGGTEATITLTAGIPSAGNPTAVTSTLVLSAGGAATMAASAPVAQAGTITFGGAAPGGGTDFIIGGITYNFVNATPFGTPAAGICTIFTNGSRTTTQTDLVGAMTGGAGTNATWLCGSRAGQLFNETGSDNATHVITVAANIAGATGYGTPNDGTSGFTYADTTTASDGTADGTHFTYWNGNAFDTAAQFATALAAAVNASADAGNVTATTSGASLIITADAAGTGGNAYTATSNFTHLTGSGTLSGGVAPGSLPDVFPAKFSLSTASAVNCSNASQPDYIVYPTGVAGSASNATVIAYDNMYASSCTGTVPTVYWAYNTGTGSVVTSPIISYDGTQIAVMESPASGAAVLRIVKFNSGDGTDRNSPFAFTPATNSFTNTNAGNVLNTAWTGCPAGSCMISIAFQTAALDTNSSPFYDFDDDILYVGDDSGRLHKFTGVFRGTPGEVITGGWPITFTVAATKLTSPVVDPITGNLYVGSANGRLYQVTTPNATPGIVNYSAAIAAAGSTGIVDSPVVDTSPFPAASVVYAFVGDSTQSATQSAVFQFSSTFTGAGTNNWLHTVAMGTTTGSTTLKVYDGDFDNAHYSTAGGTSGNLYFCGGTTAAAANPTLYRIPISGAGFGTVVATDGLATAATCSPATEFNNNGSGGSTLTTLTSTATIGTTTVTFAFTGISGTGATATFDVASTANIAVGDYLGIDSEDMLVTVKTTCLGQPCVTVDRPELGTTEATHANGATVTSFTGMTAATTSITVASGASIQNGDYIQIGSEFMNVTAGGGSTSLTVTRGALGSTAAIQAPDSNISIPALDWLFLGVTANGGDAACNSTTGCLYSFYIGTALTNTAAATDGLPAAGGTSGIVIDNGFTADGASQVYYTTLSSQTCTGDSVAGKGVGSGSCAIQASQAGLN